MSLSKRRRRGFILSPQGQQKLKEGIRQSELDSNFGGKYTIEELGVRSRLDPGTVSKILDAAGRVDRRSLEELFESVNLILDKDDYYSPSEEVEQQDLISILSQGKHNWQIWRQANPRIDLKFNKPNLSNIDLSGIDLRNADLSNSTLIETDLSTSKLNRANLRHANLTKVNLSGADLRGANLSKADLTEADFSGADLRGANLSKADLTEADFSGADLNSSNLSAVRALETDFSGASFTGACLEDWKINNRTRLENITCDFVFLKSGNEERRPINHNNFFAPGQFSELFQAALEIANLVCRNDINWKELIFNYYKTRLQHDKQNVVVHLTENENEESSIIPLSISSNAQQIEIESYFKRLYENQVIFLEKRYQAELNAKDREIEIYRKQNLDMMEILKAMANRPLSTEIIQNTEDDASRD